MTFAMNATLTLRYRLGESAHSKPFVFLSFVTTVEKVFKYITKNFLKKKDNSF